MGNRGDWRDGSRPEWDGGPNGTRPIQQGTASGPNQASQQRHMGRRFVLGALMVTGAAAAGAVALDAAARRNAQAEGSHQAALAAARRRAQAQAATRHQHPHPHPTPSSSPSQHTTPSPHPTEHPAPHHHHPDHHEPPPPVYYVEDGPNVVALTIDDGPNPEYTPEILQILQRHNITASFSMIGQNVTYYPSIAREVSDAGHLIVNHTWDHADLATLSTSRLRDEVTRAQDAIHSATGRQPTMLRAPYGAWSPAVLEYLASADLTPLDWSVDPQDWARPGVGEIVHTILSTTRSGSIILEHDGGGDRSQTVAALKIVLPKLLDEGFRFAIV
jgi:peptidoglycan/xylan/chitin deacetylase (PgdA/CDA1 family)